jgi:hypothetical protein
MNQVRNAAMKIASTANANGGQAITIIANASHAARFRSRNKKWRFKYGETPMASRSKTAPTYSDSPDAKYNPTGFIAEILSAAG